MGRGGAPSNHRRSSGGGGRAWREQERPALRWAVQGGVLAPGLAGRGLCRPPRLLASGQRLFAPTPRGRTPEESPWLGLHASQCTETHIIGLETADSSLGEPEPVGSRAHWENSTPSMTPLASISSWWGRAGRKQPWAFPTLGVESGPAPSLCSPSLCSPISVLPISVLSVHTVLVCGAGERPCTPRDVGVGTMGKNCPPLPEVSSATTARFGVCTGVLSPGLGPEGPAQASP